MPTIGYFLIGLVNLPFIVVQAGVREFNLFAMGICFGIGIADLINKNV